MHRKQGQQQHSIFVKQKQITCQVAFSGRYKAGTDHRGLRSKLKSQQNSGTDHSLEN